MIMVRHFGIGLLAHAAAALTAAGTMSAGVLWADGIEEISTYSLLSIPVRWALISVSVATFILLFTVALPFFLYPLALIISRRFGRGAALLVGGLVGLASGMELGLSGPGPAGYPMLTLDEYRIRTKESVLLFAPASVIAGMVFGWVAATFDGKKSRSSE